MKKISVCIMASCLVIILAYPALAELKLDSLSQKDIMMVKTLLKKLEPLIKEREKASTLATLTFSELYAPLNEKEAQFLKSFQELDAKTLNVKIPFRGIATGKEPLKKITGQRICYINIQNGVSREMGVQYLPENVYEKYEEMMAAMQKDIGKRLLIESGYRSSAYQLYLFVFYLKNHEYSIRETVKYVALSGYSEHGASKNQAVDFINVFGINGENNSKEFEDLPEYKWLLAHAGRFGFVLSYPKTDNSGTTFEPWHWRLDNICAHTQEKFLIVTEAVVNVRREPIDAAAGNAHDDLEETQVLYNEPLIYRGENEGWYLVEAVEQQEFSHHQIWEGYPGWVRKESVKFVSSTPKYNSIVRSRFTQVYTLRPKNRLTLTGGELHLLLRAPAEVLLTVSMGTRFKIIAEETKYYEVCLPDNRTGWISKEDLSNTDMKLRSAQFRKNLLSTAELFLGVPYLWGGRSAFGVDCSGLTSIAYRANNIFIPRDAYEQWKVAKKISSDELKTGDLIFVSAKDNPAKIIHVMLYINGERFIESSGTGNVVSIKAFKDKFGVNLAELIKRDFLVDGKRIYFGRIEF